MRAFRTRFPSPGSSGSAAPSPPGRKDLADGEGDCGLCADRRDVQVVLEDREEAVLTRLDPGEEDMEAPGAAHAEHRPHTHHPCARRVDVRVPVPVALDRRLAVEGA